MTIVAGLTLPNVRTLDGLALDNPAGGLWVNKVTGWDDGPAIRLTFVQRAQQHGAHRTTGFYDARIIQVEGTYRAPTLAAMYAFEDQLRSIPAKTQVTFTVSNLALGDRSAQVQVQSGPVFTHNGPTVTYTMTLVATDPAKYGTAWYGSANLASTAAGVGRVWPRVWPRSWGVPAGVTPGAISVPNSGNVPYWPTLRINGPVPNPAVTLVETGDWIRYGGTVAAGQWLDIDLANRRVLVNGRATASVRSQVTYSGRWLAVPPGGGSITWTADAADPAALLSVYGYQGAWA